MDPLVAFAELAKQRPKRDWSKLCFTAFVLAIGVKLDTGQLVLCMVAYDGLEPRDLPPALRSVAREIFGPLDVIPPEARRVIVVVAGARGGKSYVIAALRILHLALTVDLSGLAPGEQAFGIIIAPNPEQRDQCYGYALGAAKSHQELEAMIVGTPGVESFTIRRRDGREVSIEGIPAKRGGGAARGRSLVGAVLEECAFFLDADYVVNDVDIFKAAMPRVLPGGQTILSSTPWAEAGLLYDEFVANHPEPQRAAPHLTTHGHPHRALAAHAPTLLLRDVPFTREIVEGETRRDPTNAAREYGAQFMPLGAVAFFDAVSIAHSVDTSLVLGEALPDEEQQIVAVGADLGFRHDAFVGAAVDRTPKAYTLRAYIERLASIERIKPSQAYGELAQLAQQYGSTEVVGDLHYADGAEEALWDERGIVWIDLPGGQKGKADTYMTVKLLMDEGLLRLPNDARLLQQLREVKKKPLPGGGLSIESPRKPKGGHGDIVSALVAAVWRLSRLTLPAASEKLPENPTEREALLWERRIQEGIDRDERREQADREGLLLLEDDF